MDIIKSYLTKKGYKLPSDSNYSMMELWKTWFKVGADDLHQERFFNGFTHVIRATKQLGMAKTVCEDWANLLMNERVSISVGNEEQDKALKKILDNNKFLKNSNNLVEMYMAIGTGAFVEYIKDNKTRIDYVKGNMIFPLSWDSAGVTECAFGSHMVIDKKECVYLQMHILKEGKYVIENHLIADNQGEIVECDLPTGVAQVFNTMSDVPLFQLVKPNIINNYDLESPLGISVFANAVDVLNTIDVNFDAFNVEVETGRRIVFVNGGMLYTDDKGNEHSVIDSKESVLRYMGGMDEKEIIKDYSPAFRTSELQSTVQFSLNLLSQKVGMGTNRYEFTANGVKTATEVISENSALYSNLKKHELVLEEALIGMLKGIESLSSLSNDKLSISNISIDFDDSIIQDKEAMRKQYKEEVAMGIMTPVEYRMKVYNEDEATAKKMIAPVEEVID